MKKVDFLYFDAGGGHRAAATALKSVIDKGADGVTRPWDIQLVNLQEILDSLDVFRKVTGLRLEDVYNTMLAKGWTLGSAQGVKFMHAVIRLYHRPTVKLLEEYWTKTSPDLVVSLVPNFNRALCESLRNALPKVPFVTIITDLADYPPHFWMEKQDQYMVCGSDKAVQQAKSLGYKDDRIFRTSGMILRPEFYQKVEVDREAELKKLGLDPTKPVGLVLFGGQGSKVMLEIAGTLSETQLIFICGRNEELAGKLRAMPAGAGRFIEGFTQRIPYYMGISDFMIGKPGPGSISEAVAMGLPVIVEKNAWTLPQERYNSEWVLGNGVGLVLKNFRQVKKGVEQLLNDLPKYKTAVGKVHNRAVFEIPGMLEKILATDGHGLTRI